MATGNGIIRKLRGKVGDLVYRVRDGEQVVSAYNPQVRNPRTELQMLQRTKWLNVLGMYKVMQPYLKEGFENKQEGRTDYNRFMSLNLQAEPVYITREQFDNGGSVIAPYIITQGSLPPIEMTENVTDIAAGFSASDTVGAVSEDLLRRNPRLRQGDALAFFVVVQTKVENTPVARVHTLKLTLDLMNDSLLSALTDSNISIGATEDNLLEITTAGVVYAVAAVHSRRSDRLLVSTARLTVLGDVNTILSLPSFSTAASSLGYIGNNVFLAPDSIVDSYDNDSGDDEGEGGNDDEGGGGGSGGGSGGGTGNNPL